MNQPVSASRYGVRLAGTGIALPTKVLTNHDLAQMVNTSDEWITQRTGIKERRLAQPGQTTRHLAAAALQAALTDASLQPRDLDLVLCATLTPEMICPSTAAQIVADLEAIPAGALDINAACSGFVYGLVLADSLIRLGRFRTVAVIGSDVLSSITDWSDRRTCILFGDGAGAAILTASDDPRQGCLYHSLHSDGTYWTELYCPRGPENIPPGDAIFSGKFNTLQMNGRVIFKFAVNVLQDMIDQALAATGLQPADLAMVIPHQSNIRILENARQRFDLPPEKMYINIDRYGNTSAASIPICLHELRHSGQIKTGDLVLFLGIGGGMTWATGLWRL